MEQRTHVRVFATLLAVALVATTMPAAASPATATLTGTVIGPVATTPLAGATVVVHNGDAAFTSAPTGTDGAFTVQGVTPGVSRIELKTKDGAFEVATPITLAPGETRGLHLAVRQATDDDKKKKKGGAAVPPDGGKLAAMIVTIVGFAAMGAGAIDAKNNNSSTTPPASQSNPGDK
ncbi:MAG TPA: carboxypeptidase regulatory-like domain-containing protein [Candidatus Polarisedimenticolaceae bacterium]|nr:carboxypeptidase regulatory-like domain-containing protein [Candidatus Polarisedimenticolaceae bacterium]